MDRGDTRMNLAVAHRLQNPRLSLFECLILGGFRYDRDVGSGVDDETVTLAQRKNQLNRRCRRVRQKDHHHSASSSLDGADGGKREVASASESPVPSSLTCSSEDGEVAQVVAHAFSPEEGKRKRGIDRLENAENHHQQQQRLMNAVNNRMKQDDQSSAEDLMGFDFKSYLHHYHEIRQSQMTTKNTMDAHIPEVFGYPEDAKMVSTGPDSSIPMFPTQGDTSQSQYSNQCSHSSPLEEHIVLIDPPMTANLPNHAHHSTTTRQSTDCNKSFTPPEGRCGTPLPTADDNAVAAAVSTDSPRQRLALQLFEREPHAVYQRCMLSAGYSLKESQDMSSKSYRTFTFLAWRKECERLQALMATYGNDDDNEQHDHHNYNSTNVQVQRHTGN